MKISSKINLVLINGSVLIILVAGIVINVFSSNELRKLSENSIVALNDSQAHEISTFLNSEKEVVLSLAASTVFRDYLSKPEDSVEYNKQKIISTTRLKRSVEAVSQIGELFILDKNGKVVASTNVASEGVDKSNDEYFIEGKKNVYIKSLYYSSTIKEAAYAVSAPILDDADKSLLGVVVARMNPKNLYSTIQSKMANTKTGESFLVDINNFLISEGRYLTKKDILNKKIETDNVRDCFSSIDKGKDTEGILKTNIGNYIDYRGVAIVGAHHYIADARWCLITKQDTSEVLWPSFFLSIIIVLVSMAVLAIFMPISYFITSKITKSITNLQKVVQTRGEGDISEDVIIKSGDEVEELSIAFDKMIKDVKKSREDVDRKVIEQTKEIVEKKQLVENQQKATLNILEDVEEEKIKTNALLAGIGEGVIATDSNTNVIFMNRAAEDALGWTFAEVVGKNLYDFLKMYDEKDKSILDENRPFHVALSTGNKVFSSVSKNYFYEKRSGEKFPVSISVTPIKVEDKLIGAINVFRDITHDKEVDTAKTEFVSLASHQLRTPLSAINWYTEMLLAGDAGKITDEQKQYLEEVYRSNKRMVELVNSLLNVSRIDLGTFAIVPEPTDITEVSKSILMELTPMIKTKKMNIEETYDKKIPKINVDAKLIRIIFQNLISNAVKYTPEGGKVSVSIAKDAENALIKIQDTGDGIPKKDQSRMFEKLFRADNVREKETDGTGLGMYIVKSILEQSGGTISFESEENKGTTFFVSIPLSGMKAKEGAKDLS